jgi:tetratricopeptide (TPR) repeat protein
VARFTKIPLPLGPLSPIMQSRSINYHFNTIDMDFAEFRAAAKKRERTVNDLFLAAISVGMYRYHEKMGRPVGELRMNMPISLRTSDDQSNAVTIARFEIPISNVIDDVLEAAANTVRSWRAEPALKLADYFAELTRFLPPELVSAAAQTSDLTASNVPGVPVPVWLAGAKIERMYPLVGTIGAAINAYRRALSLDPGHTPTHQNLAVALLLGGDIPGCRAAFRQTIRLLEEQGRPEEARALARQAATMVRLDD